MPWIPPDALARLQQPELGKDRGHVVVAERLARSLPNARGIADELTAKGVSLSLGGRSYDPAALVAARSTLTGQHLVAFIGT